MGVFGTRLIVVRETVLGDLGPEGAVVARDVGLGPWSVGRRPRHEPTSRCAPKTRPTSVTDRPCDTQGLMTPDRCRRGEGVSSQVCLRPPRGPDVS